jgi:hypothetical protein
MLKRLIARFCFRNKEGRFASLTKEAIRCYEAAEGKRLGEALSWIKKGDDLLALRDMTK